MESSIMIHLFVLFFISTCYHNVYAGAIFSIVDNGAIGDGKTDCSQALFNTWEKACRVDGATVLVPAGTFYVKSATLEGPCNGQTVFRVMGTIMASTYSINLESWIEIQHVDRLAIVGNGIFDGQGASAWARGGNRPVSLKLKFLRGASIQGITSMNSKFFHMHINDCDNVEIRDIKLFAPEDSPNTDGIHIGRSNNIRINNAKIATGDDCISLGDGSKNINISSIACGPGHGISIGSLGKYPNEDDVVGVFVRDCTLINTDNGLRIKTWAPSPPSAVYDVTFQDIKLKNVRNPIIIDQQYCPHNSCTTGGDSRVKITNVKFRNIYGSSSSEIAVNALCSESAPCKDIEFSGLDIRVERSGAPTIASCSNVDGFFRGNIVPIRCT